MTLRVKANTRITDKQQEVIDAAITLLEEYDKEDVADGGYIFEHWVDNNNDYNKIVRCSVCGRPLNDSLTWIHDEFYDNHKQYSTTRNRLMVSETAFGVRVMLESLPSADCGGRVKLIDVIAYAKKVIRLLRNDHKKGKEVVWDIAK